MAELAEAHVYSYPFASAVSTGPGGVRVAVATSGGDADDEPVFYSGGLVAPFRAATLMIAVSGIAASRFYVPPAMLQRILLAADPVVLSDGERLRFESLSACCGVYARADLLPDALAEAPVARGTTNVDFNPPMRAALARLRDEHDVSLTVGDDGLRLEHADGAVEERRVRIPERWIRSLGEVQALQAAMEPVIAVGGAEAFRFLRSLPRGGTGRAACFVAPSGSGIRLAHTPAPGAVRVAGAERIRALEIPARDATRLVIHRHESGASGWSLQFPDARLTLIMSPEPSRGLSGEGALLSEAIGSNAGTDARLLAALRWNVRLAPADVEVDSAKAAAGLARLAAGGLVGYDLTDGGYFYRALPIGRADPAARMPRLVGARELVDAGRVSIERASGGGARAVVKGRDGDYLVSIDGNDATCTCAWFAKHRGDRGPCRHVLAVEMILAE
jgi:SWIM zinc finger